MVLKKLTEKHSPRGGATQQELEAALYLVERLTTMGYDVSLQEFGIGGPVSEMVVTSQAGDHSVVRQTIPLDGAIHGAATGTLTHVGLARRDDIPKEGLQGQVALIERGDIMFGKKVERVAAAGAVGAIIYNNHPGLFRGWMHEYLPSVPTVLISQDAGLSLHDLVEQQDLVASVSVGESPMPSQNIIADKGQLRDGGPRVIIGAHYDTLVDSQGASDNGSGVATVLTIAEHIAGQAYPFDVRVVLFGTEELGPGLLGSRHYVEKMTREEIVSTIAMINFDALGFGTTLMSVGDFRLTDRAEEIGRSFGMNIGPFSETPWESYGGASDHAAFRQAGIPVLYLTSDDLSLINSPEDTIEHINPELLGRAAEVGLLVIESLSDGLLAPTPLSPVATLEPLPIAGSGTVVGDRDALVAFYKSTGGDGWENSNNWLGDAPLDEWHGVTAEENGRVTELILNANSLTGKLPPEIGYLTELRILDLSTNLELAAHLPAELGYLTKLESLILSSTPITGVLPRELGNLTNLKRLHITNSRLSGPIPGEMGSLTSLVELEVSFNELTGELPRELGNLANLQRLHLMGNRLSGEVPHELGRLTNLRGLFLARNQLSGEIPPELGNLKSLERLSLHSNALQGEIPPTLGNLASLSGLDVAYNRLTGEFPHALRGLESLEYMGLHGNELTGCLPDELEDVEPYHGAENTGLYLCAHLKPVHPDDSDALVALYNAAGGPYWWKSQGWLNDDAPLAEWHGVETNDDGRVTQIWLGSNQLIGTLPAELGKLSKLQWLNVGNLHLGGHIPPELGALTELERISMSNSDLTGEIPPELGNLKSLRGLFLGHNELTGEIPEELGNLPRLDALELNDNHLTGNIPRSLGNISRLKNLNLSRNQLTGAIPGELGDLAALERLYLHDNQLTGAIPAGLGDLTRLHTLFLSNNQLAGEIPAGLGTMGRLYLGGNGALSGCIPGALFDVRESDLATLTLPQCGQ